MAMLAELRLARPEVRARPGSAEEIPLPDASVDAAAEGEFTLPMLTCVLRVQRL